MTALVEVERLLLRTTNRRMAIDMDKRRYFEVADREDLTFDEKLAIYGRMADDYFDREAFEEFSAKHFGPLEAAARDYFGGSDFDELLVRIVCSTFQPHEHEMYVERYRTLVRQGAEQIGVEDQVVARAR